MTTDAKPPREPSCIWATLDALRAELAAANETIARESDNAVRRIAWLETELGTAQKVAEQLREELAAEKVRSQEWHDVDDEWTSAIHDAHPTRIDSHDEYGVAMRMVGHRHGKHELVSLVCWLLVSSKVERRKREEAEKVLASVVEQFRRDFAAQTKRAEEAEAKVAMLTRDVEAAALSDAHYDGDLGDCKRDLATLREALEEVRAMAIRSLATGTPSVASILVSCGDALASVQQKASGESVDAGMHPGSTARDHAPPRGSGEGGFASPLNLAFQQAWVPREELTAAQVKLAAQTKRAEEAMTECELLNADKASFAQQLQQSNYALVTLRKAALEFIRDSAPHPFYAGNSGENLRALASVQQKTSRKE